MCAILCWGNRDIGACLAAFAICIFAGEALHGAQPADAAKACKTPAEIQDAVNRADRNTKGPPTQLKSLFRLAQLGDAGAQSNLGLAFARGSGVSQDHAEAACWYRKAALQGNRYAQQSLGLMFMNGQLVTKDQSEAYVWVSLAALEPVGEFKELADAREALAGKMTPRQLEEARRRVEDLDPGGHDGVFRLTPDVIFPKMISKVEAQYTDKARDAKLSCTIILEIEINERGHIQNPRVFREVPSHRVSPEAGCLDLAGKAIEAVMKWRFHPALKEGKPVTVSNRVEFNFRLR